MPSAFVTALYRLAGLERPDRWVDPSHADWAAGLEAGRGSSGDGGAGFLGRSRLGTTELETGGAAVAASDPPERARGRAAPARIKLRVENERTLEVKIVYRLGGPEKKQGGAAGWPSWLGGGRTRPRHGGAQAAAPPRANMYRVDVYLFCPSELEPADPTSSFYANLFVVIRLHTPHVELADLAGAGAVVEGGSAKRPSALLLSSSRGGDGGGGGAATAPTTSAGVATSLLTALARSFGDMHAYAAAGAAARGRAAALGWADPRRHIALKAAAAAAAARATRADDAVQLMRLLGCIFRAAVRRATGVAADAALAVAAGQQEEEGEGDAGGGPTTTAARAAARAGIDLVEQACGALEALATVCDPCRADATGAIPPYVREAASLVEEHTILEAEQALLKLLVDLEGGRSSLMSPAAAAAAAAGPGDTALFMSVPGGAPGGPFPPPPPLPRPAPAGWAGRFPHLDAVRESAAAARRRSTGAGLATRSASRGGGWGGGGSVTGGDSRTSAHSGGRSGAATPAGGGGGSPPPASLLPPPPGSPTLPAEDGPARHRRASAPVAVPPPPAAAAAPGSHAARLARHSAGGSSPRSSLGRRPSLEMMVAAHPPTALGAGLRGQSPPPPAGSAGAPPRSTPPPLPTPAAEADLASARALLREAVAGLEAARLRRGYTESLMRDGPPEVNEGYTNRRQVLKKHARAAISLTPRTRPPPTWLQDVVGMSVAAVAMAFATWTVWLAQRYAGEQYGALYIMILVMGYVIKDRLKELAKRWLQPAASFFGVVFYDRIVAATDGRGETVGTVAERVRLLDPEALNPRVRALRNYGAALGAHARAAAQPERVLAYSKDTKVAWSRLDARLQGVGALSDIMRFDLGPLTRRMQAPTEPHIRLSRAGDCGPEAVPCARVYHVNVVLRVRAAAPAPASGAAAPRPRPSSTPAPMVMLLERARVVMNQDGILRLEAAAGSLLRERERGTGGGRGVEKEAGGAAGGGRRAGSHGGGVLTASVARARRAVGWVMGRGA